MAELKSLDDHNLEMRRKYDRNGGPQRNGIACPLCGNELIDRFPGTILPSNPPLVEVHCSACSWVGHRIC